MTDSLHLLSSLDGRYADTIAPLCDQFSEFAFLRDRTRLTLTLRGKRLGLSLAEIKELIDMYDTVEDESTQLQSFLDVLAQRRAALEQQRDDIQAVLKEIARFERQCREMLKSDQLAAPSVRQPKRRATGSG